MLLTIAMLLGAVFLAMFALEGSPRMPFRHDYRSVVSAGKPFLKDNKTSKEYKSFRDFFQEQRMHSNYARVATRQHRFVGKARGLAQKYIAEWTDPRMGIRSAWYVNWDKRAYLSLKNNIKHLNVVLPEWFFIDPNTDQLESRIDQKALKLMHSAGVPILPMLTNNYGAKFRSEPIGRIMSDPKKRMALINQLADQCKQHGFSGINLDLEDLNINDNALLVTLVKDFATVFHAHGLYVTQAIAAFNDDYDVQELAKYDDYLFLMAYDEHNSTSQPGAVSSQRWVEKATDWAAKNVPNDKIVLGLAAYGYDWTEGKTVGTAVSFDQIIATAQNAGAKIAFNDDTYNLDFSYKDEGNGTLHHVFFPDAATTFNIMRFGTQYHMAGFGLWRLGTEDKRIWRFYGKDMAWENASKLSVSKLMQLNGTDDVNFVGSGEVLNVTSEPHHGKIAVTIDKDNCLITEEYYQALPTTYTIQRLGKCKPKQLVLTFDDGPDEHWTPTVLSTLKKYKVPAAFFMVGLQMEKNLPLVKQVFDDGHTIGNHTFTHHDMSENSDRRSYAELKLTRMLIESITGQSTILFRAPYNADADPTGHEEIWPMIIASRRNYLFVGESIDPNDWQPGVTADQIYKRVIDGVHNEDGHIILLHDAGGDTREATVAALPRIIETLQREGYQFISLEQYLDMSRQTLMPPIEKGNVYYAMQANLSLAEFIYHVSDFLTALFLVFLVLGFVRLLFMYILMVREKRTENHRNYAPISAGTAPEVSIIVPAYNEEVNIVRTISNLKQHAGEGTRTVRKRCGSYDYREGKWRKGIGSEPWNSSLHHRICGLYRCRHAAAVRCREQADAPFCCRQDGSRGRSGRQCKGGKPAKHAYLLASHRVYHQSELRQNGLFQHQCHHGHTRSHRRIPQESVGRGGWFHHRHVGRRLRFDDEHKRTGLHYRERELCYRHDRSARDTPPVRKTAHTLVLRCNASLLETPFVAVCNIGKRFRNVGYAQYVGIPIHHTNILSAGRRAHAHRLVHGQCCSSFYLLFSVFACRCKRFHHGLHLRTRTSVGSFMDYSTTFLLSLDNVLRAFQKLSEGY